MITNYFKIINGNEQAYFDSKEKMTGRKAVIQMFECISSSDFEFIKSNTHDDLKVLQEQILSSLPVYIKTTADFVNGVYRRICTVIWKKTKYKSIYVYSIQEQIRRKVFQKYLPFIIYEDEKYHTPDRIYRPVDPLPGIFGVVRIEKKKSS